MFKNQHNNIFLTREFHAEPYALPLYSQAISLTWGTASAGGIHGDSSPIQLGQLVGACLMLVFFAYVFMITALQDTFLVINPGD